MSIMSSKWDNYEVVVSCPVETKELLYKFQRFNHIICPLNTTKGLVNFTKLQIV